ncbi:MAG TPA: ATP-binding protein [Bryobacteraceae bacterium]|nr:ATP-binding protein [Bryobacteraceae bacterium]
MEFPSVTGEIASRPALYALVIAAALFAAGLINWLTGGAWVQAYAIPVALAAVLYGWRGALVLSTLSAAAVFAFSHDQSVANRYLQCVALLVLACFTAAAADRERRLLHHYRQVADQLSGVYEKVQANFEAMKRVERLSAIGQLSAGLAHEIRNPLASISGAAAILARSQNLDQKNSKCLEIITSECTRLNGLLTNFLNFARPRPPRLQMIQLEPVLDNVLELASHGVRGKAVRFEKQVTAGLPPVECDLEQLEQVLLNLMINAIEASPERGTVTLSAVKEDSKIAINVVDHGHGVSPAHIDRLFDPFFTTKEHGTGLGLPVAHQIMRQMGGSLSAQPNQDQGMTFSVVLPSKVQS